MSKRYPRPPDLRLIEVELPPGPRDDGLRYAARYVGTDGDTGRALYRIVPDPGGQFADDGAGLWRGSTFYAEDD